MRPGTLLPTALCSLVIACGAAPAAPGAVAPTASATESTPPAAEASAAASSAPAAPALLHASVTEIRVSTESPIYKRAKVVFDNPSSSPCSIKGYALSWPGGSKPAQPEAFSIPAGESRVRWLRVHPNDGDLGSLTADAATVSLESDCPTR